MTTVPQASQRKDEVPGHLEMRRSDRRPLAWKSKVLASLRRCQSRWVATSKRIRPSIATLVRVRMSWMSCKRGPNEAADGKNLEDGTG